MATELGLSTSYLADIENGRVENPAQLVRALYSNGYDSAGIHRDYTAWRLAKEGNNLMPDVKHGEAAALAARLNDWKLPRDANGDVEPLAVARHLGPDIYRFCSHIGVMPQRHEMSPRDARRIWNATHLLAALALDRCGVRYDPETGVLTPPTRPVPRGPWGVLMSDPDGIKRHASRLVAMQSQEG